MSTHRFASADHLPPPQIIIDYLNAREIPYQIMGPTSTASKSLKENRLNTNVRSVVVINEQGPLLVISGTNGMLTFANLNKFTGKLCRICLDSDYKPPSELSKDALPALPDFLNLPAIIDEAVLTLDFVCFYLGSQNYVVQLNQFNFRRLLMAIKAGPLMEPLETVELTYSSKLDNFVTQRIKTRLNDVHALPMIPPQVDALLKLRVDPEADAHHLAAIVERDASLSAQLLSWASSPMYGYNERVTSIMDVIVRVMGFDLVMNLSLSVALTQHLRLKKHGSLGLDLFWRDALYTATLIDELITQIPYHRQPIRGLSYLSGLLHNFGYLLLGLLLPHQFELLDEAISLNPEQSYLCLEQKIVGFNHMEIGAWLMQAWHLPRELVTATKWHHYLDYEGPDEAIVHCVILANCLLNQRDMGAGGPERYARSLKILGLGSEQVQRALERFSLKKTELDLLILNLNKSKHEH